MKCDKCGSSNVVTKIVIQSDKGNEELNLCPVCFQTFVNDHPGITNGPAGKSINEFLGGALHYLNNGLKTLNEANNITVDDTKICPGCSTPVMNIKKENTTGCSKCYEFFSKEIDRILYTNTGKHYFIEEEIQMSRDQMSESLKEKIKEAVKSENYEIAAILRDKLRKLK